MEFIFDYQTIVHYSLHFLAPAIIAFTFFQSIWKKAWMIMLLTMLVDLDHLLATPIFDPNRCGIGFHILHSEIAIALYFLLLLVPNRTFKIIGVGLLFHMMTDYIDCLLM